MKKILTILAVALLSIATVFAAVNFSGSATVGVALNRGNTDDWRAYVWGDDNTGSKTATLSLGAADSDGLWSANISIDGSDPYFSLDDNTVLDADFSINIAKAIASAYGTEAPVDVILSTVMNDDVTALRAYANKSGNNLDRVRTSGQYFNAGLRVNYESLLSVFATYTAPLANDGKDFLGVSKSEITASVLVTPMDGLKASVAYGYNGEAKFGDRNTNDNVLGVAVDADLQKLLDLDFSIGLAISDRFLFEDKVNTLAAVVYGGYENVTGYAEYGLITGKSENAEHVLDIGVDATIIDGLKVGAAFGAMNLAKFADTYFVEGDVSYTLGNVGYKLAVAYHADKSTANDLTDYDNLKGFSIIPSVSVSF